MNRKLLNSELGRHTLDSFAAAQRLPITIVLDNIRSQFNIGSAFRSADSFAAERIMLCGICATPPTAEIHKSALGAEFSIAWEHFEKTEEAIAKLIKEGYTVISIEQAENCVQLQQLKEKILEPQQREQGGSSAKYAIVFGNEVNGVQQHIVDMSHYVIEIPQFGTKHSLNVSVCVGVVLWEFLNRLQRV